MILLVNKKNTMDMSILPRVFLEPLDFSFLISTFFSVKVIKVANTNNMKKRLS